jgi:hypothetical protein
VIVLERVNTDAVQPFIDGKGVRSGRPSSEARPR